MDDGYGIEAARKLGFDEHQVFKTLMADTGAARVVGVVPVSGHMDLKALAAAVGAKKAAMADPKVAMRESGYVVGGISPFGQRTRHATVLDESPGVRGQARVQRRHRPAGSGEGSERRHRPHRHLVARAPIVNPSVTVRHRECAITSQNVAIPTFFPMCHSHECIRVTTGADSAAQFGGQDEVHMLLDGLDSGDLGESEPAQRLDHTGDQLVRHRGPRGDTDRAHTGEPCGIQLPRRDRPSPPAPPPSAAPNSRNSPNRRSPRNRIARRRA